MALIVEDGTGLSNSNSYLSVADADTYHTTLLNSAWTGSNSVKEAALRKATNYLDESFAWVGTIKSLSQALNWPRTNAHDSQGRDVSNSVPVKIKNAVAELALLSLTEDLSPTISNSNYIKREKVGEIEVEYQSGAPISNQYPKISKLLSDLYVYRNGGNSVKLVRT
jgi:hypothetical protein